MRNPFKRNHDKKNKGVKIIEVKKEKVVVKVDEEEEKKPLSDEKKGLNEVAPKAIGKLDMVIAFDTTGSMARYIDDVRHQVAKLVPSLFKDNDDLRIGIVAFGDYCDMDGKDRFGKAYQCLPLTRSENDIIKFIRESKNTNGGDGDEFYELVIKKIVEESDWREGSTRSILLISDAEPHEIGYTYEDYVVDNQIDWRFEAKKAAKKMIKIDTVSINPHRWYREISAMTNGVNVPFSSSHHTSDLIMASTMARGSEKQRRRYDEMCSHAPMDADGEMNKILCSFSKAREED